MESVGNSSYYGECLFNIYCLWHSRSIASLTHSITIVMNRGGRLEPPMTMESVLFIIFCLWHSRSIGSLTHSITIVVDRGRRLEPPRDLYSTFLLFKILLSDANTICSNPTHLVNVFSFSFFLGEKGNKKKIKPLEIFVYGYC